MTDKRHGTGLVVLLVIVIVVAGTGVLLYGVGTPLVLIAIQQAREAARRREYDDAGGVPVVHLGDFGSTHRSFRTSAEQFLRFSPPHIADLIADSR